MLVLQVILLTICALVQVKASYVMPFADAELHVYALPVGQGDATVIQCPIGTGGLTIVDFGSSVRNSVYNSNLNITYMTDDEIDAFLQLGTVNTIDYVYLTHGDRDHYNIFTRIKPPPNTVKGVLIGCEEGNYKGLTSWLQQVDSFGKLKKFLDLGYGGCTTNCGSNVAICSGGVNMRVMGANLDIYDTKKDCTNGDSLVTRLEYGNFKLLLPGDLEDYSGFSYDDDGFINSSIIGWDGKPGLLRTLVDAWAPPNGGIQADYYRLAHHGTYPHGNKDFFLNAIRLRYGFSSSMLPGTPGTFNHPNCKLYDLLIALPTIATVAGSEQQTEYSCGLQNNRETETENNKGVYTTAVCDTEANFHNYIIKIDTDGATHSVNPNVVLSPSSIMTCNQTNSSFLVEV